MKVTMYESKDGRRMAKAVNQRVTLIVDQRVMEQRWCLTYDEARRVAREWCDA